MFWRKFSPLQRHAYIACLVFGCAIATSVVRSGATHGHYLIQLAPAASLLSAIVLCSYMRVRTFKFVVLALTALGLTLSTYIIVHEEYQSMIDRAISRQPLSYGGSYEISSYIEQNSSPDDTVYLMITHLAYWMMPAQPLSKCVTHPSNITKTDLLPYCFAGREATPEAEMEYILSQQPTFIVKRDDDWYLRTESDTRDLLETTLEEDYQLVKSVQRKRIYQRR
jgi:hypothetical protein